MFRNLLQITLRRLWHQPTFSLINALGLSLGMTAFLLLMQYLRHEWSYDQQSPHAANIWRAYNETIADGTSLTQDANTHSALGPTLQRDVPEVVAHTRLYNRNEHSVTFLMSDRPVKVNGTWMVDQAFFQLFPQQFLQGNPRTCLEKPFQVVLTRSVAELLFSGENAIGKILEVNSGAFEGQFTVTGIVADPPPNTHLKFNALFSIQTRYAAGFEDNWSGYWDYNYFLLRPDADPDKVRARLAHYSNTYLKEEGIRLRMQRLQDIHLGSNLMYEIEPNADPRTLQLLLLIALFILGIAFVNYINLSTARAMERAKEVSLRKVIGAQRWQLVGQFLMEGLLLSVVALSIALVLLHYGSPFFIQLTGRDILHFPGYDRLFWLLCLGTLLASLLLAGLYPALVLSAHAPGEILRNRWLNPARGGQLRQGLVVLQFASSVGLIISVLTVQGQLRFMQKADLGLTLDQVMALKIPSFDWRQDSLLRSKMVVLKHELTQLPGVQGVATSEIVPGLGISTISGTSSGMYWLKKPQSVARSTIYTIGADAAFFSTFGVKFLAGGFFARPSERPSYEDLIINESALRVLGFPNPQAAIGEQIAYQGSTDGFKMTIRGVVADFHIESLKEPARPTLYPCLPVVNNGFLSLKVDAEQASSLLAALQPAWKKVFPDQHLDYWFLDQQFLQQYQAEQRLARIFTLFAALAVGIACLGLFGLAAYLVVQRRKEVGVRKVLGAGIAQIVVMLSGDFLKLILLAIAIGTPLAWYWMNQWLEGFAHRIPFQWYYVPLAAVLVIGVALIAVGSQSVKAAMENPVDALRGE